MELAGSRSIVLDAGIPEAEVASDETQPAANHNREADDETEQQRRTGRRFGAAVDTARGTGFPTRCP